MQNTLSSFTSREIAVGLWIGIGFLSAMSNTKIRQAFLDSLKIFFKTKIFIPFLIFLLYITGMIWIAAKVGFWVTSAAKDTSLWVIGTAFATFFSLNNVSTDKDYVRKIILDNIKFILIIEFVLNLYTFNLAIEFFLLVPLITFVVILNAFAALKPEYKGVKTFLEYVLAIIGFVLLIYTFREIVIHFQDFATAKTLRDFMLPPAFSVSLIPCLYFMALFMQYETLFVRINFANRHSDYAKMIKRKTIMICHLNLAKLIRFSRNLGYPKVNSTDEMEDLIKRGISNS